MKARQTCLCSYFFFIKPDTCWEALCPIFWLWWRSTLQRGSISSHIPVNAHLTSCLVKWQPVFVLGRVAALKSSLTKNFGTPPDCEHGRVKILQRKVLPFCRWSEWPRNKTGTQAALQIYPWFLNILTQSTQQLSTRIIWRGRRCSAVDKWCLRRPLCHT